MLWGFRAGAKTYPVSSARPALYARPLWRPGGRSGSNRERQSATAAAGAVARAGDVWKE